MAEYCCVELMRHIADGIIKRSSLGDLGVADPYDSQDPNLLEVVHCPNCGTKIVREKEDE